MKPRQQCGLRTGPLVDVLSTASTILSEQSDRMGTHNANTGLELFQEVLMRAYRFIREV